MTALSINLLFLGSHTCFSSRFLLPSSLIIFNDIMAYFCGVLFGKKIIKRDFLALSPNKTWEGFIGAAFCTVIFSFFVSLLLSRTLYSQSLTHNHPHTQFAQLLSQYQWFTCPKHVRHTLSNTLSG